MRKGFTLVELVLVIVIVGLLALSAYSGYNRIVTDNKCVRNGYTLASKNGFNKYCTKVENGNTIVIHADSLR